MEEVFIYKILFDKSPLFYIITELCKKHMDTVPVVQLVRMPGCDSGGREFEPRQAPHLKKQKQKTISMYSRSCFLYFLP